MTLEIGTLLDLIGSINNFQSHFHQRISFAEKKCSYHVISYIIFLNINLQISMKFNLFIDRWRVFINTFLIIRNLLTDWVTAIRDYNVKLATMLLQELKTIADVKRDFRVIQSDTHRRQILFRYLQHFRVDFDLHDSFYLWMFSHFTSNSAISTSNYQNLIQKYKG